ncbi:hypothetical protein [Streptomyces winkii]|uniref:hypothetical protein n=1 Tax=Streptomyces winkii TaxID=3051178 RepID=UPI0028D40B29|nr:hypothetical protein [Streptomyces sp. DSM 40971]
MLTPIHRQRGGRRRLPSPAFRFDLRADPYDHGPERGTGLGSGPGAHPPADFDTEGAAHASAAAAGLVRWGAFCCAVAPLTLLACGVPFTTVLVAAVGLIAVTAACGALLRGSDVYAPRSPGRFGTGRPGPHRGRHGRTGTGLHRGGKYWGFPGEQ